MDEKARILIVDDSAFARKTMETLLQPEGYHLSLAASGTEALALLAADVPDLVLLDVVMPGIDGFEVCRQIRQNPRTAHLPIIMVTAIDGPDHRLQALEAGADDFIKKPYDHVELRARVRTITHLHRQRHQRERELEQGRNRTRAILEAVGEAVVVTGRTGEIEYLNPAAVALTGFSNAEAAGDLWSEWQKASLPPVLYEQMQSVTQAGQTWRGEAISYRKDGSSYHLAITVTPFFEPLQDNSKCTAAPLGFVSVWSDITALKAAQHLKEKFISNVSHELRNPLSIITLHSGNLDNLYDSLDDRKRHDLIRRIREQSRLLKELVDDVLEISHLDSGQATKDQKEVELSQILVQEIEAQRPIAEKKKQKLVFLGLHPAWVHGNLSQIRQIVRNLLSNAIKYTPERGKITCEMLLTKTTAKSREWPGLEQLPAGEWVAWRVVDNGIGIAAHDQPHIFERFYRVHQETNIPGTGLGLAITRELVQLHRGQIHVTSAPKKGSIFVVYLPKIRKE